MEKTSMVWRLLWLLRTIEESPVGISAERLACDCELSQRSVYRYVKILRLAGVVIETGKNGYRVEGRMSLSAVNLNLPEAFALMLASEQVIGGKAPFSSTLNEAIRKILAILPPGLRKETRDGRKHVLMGRSGPIDYSKTGDVFDLIDSAVKEHAVLSIEYRGIDDERASQRLVNPYGLMFLQDLWYLAAWCQKRLEIRMFRLDRLNGARRTGDTFIPPTDFSLADYMKDAWQAVRGDPVLIKVRFYGRARRLILEGKRHDSQQVLENDGENALVSFKLGGLRDFASWLVGFGGEVEVIEPLELRKLVAETALAAAAVNG